MKKIVLLCSVLLLLPSCESKYKKELKKDLVGVEVEIKVAEAGRAHIKGQIDSLQMDVTDKTGRKNIKQIQEWLILLDDKDKELKELKDKKRDIELKIAK